MHFAQNKLQMHICIFFSYVEYGCVFHLLLIVYLMLRLSFPISPLGRALLPEPRRTAAWSAG